MGLVSGTPEVRAIVHEARALAELSVLPAEGDRQLLMPPSVEIWLHPVGGTSFDLGYDFAPDELTLITLRPRQTY